MCMCIYIYYIIYIYKDHKNIPKNSFLGQNPRGNLYVFTLTLGFRWVWALSFFAVLGLRKCTSRARFDRFRKNRKKSCRSRAKRTSVIILLRNGRESRAKRVFLTKGYVAANSARKNRARKFLREIRTCQWCRNWNTDTLDSTYSKYGHSGTQMENIIF